MFPNHFLGRQTYQRNQIVPNSLQPLLQYAGLDEKLVEAVDGPRVRVRGRWLLNFAATNYLGLAAHPTVQKLVSYAINKWGNSIGMPRHLAADHLSRRLEIELANLVGQEMALAFPSTTHIAFDVLPLLAGRDGMLFVDEGAYPISLKAAFLAAGHGAEIQRFRHNYPPALSRLLQANASRREKVIICDGVYGAEGRVAPLSDFDRLARAFDAALYVDDAHGVGVLGNHPSSSMPFGTGGSGTPPFFGLPSGNVVHVGSLGKAFGVPIAFVAGPASFIERLWSMASTFTHSSPPAIPVLASALGTLRVNVTRGDFYRRRLVDNICLFRYKLRRAGVHLPENSRLPVQSLPFATPAMAEAFCRRAWQAGIWAVLQIRPPDLPEGGIVRFVMSANHSKADIDAAASVIISCLGHS